MVIMGQFWDVILKDIPSPIESGVWKTKSFSWFT
jgi:hypothetical protein